MSATLYQSTKLRKDFGFRDQLTRSGLSIPSNTAAEVNRADEATGHNIPTIEAACASKFAALVSPYREWNKKSYDAGDLRNIMGPNATTLNQALLKELGDLVYPGGGSELLEFLQLTIHKKPFPV